MQIFKQEISRIKYCFTNNNLPGLLSQMKMAPVTRLNELKEVCKKSAKKSAVLILFYPKNEEIHIAFIKRSLDNSVHSGQISFPGGKLEETDKSLIHCALRESNEEVGIIEESIEIVGMLSKLYIPPSNFDVFPVIGITYNTPDFKINGEVQKVLEISLDSLINPKNCITRNIKHRNGNLVDVPCFLIQGEIIWGATAMIISELIDVIKDSDQSQFFVRSETRE